MAQLGYYYAHLNEIFIKVGQKVSNGDRLGTEGRLTVHQSKEGYPKPMNPFMELIKASCQER